MQQQFKLTDMIFMISINEEISGRSMEQNDSRTIAMEISFSSYYGNLLDFGQFFDQYAKGCLS